MSELLKELSLTTGMGVDQRKQVIDRLKGMLDALPPDPESLGDRRLRETLEAFLAGYALGSCHS